MTDTYGELDVLFITTPSIKNPSKSKKCNKKCNKKYNNKTYKKAKQHLEQARIRAKEFREKRKAQFLSSIKYSQSLQKQNEKLKLEICHLKIQLNTLIVLCQKTSKNS